MWNFSDVDLWALIIIWPSQKIFNNSHVPHLRKQQISVFRYLSTHPPTHPSIHSSIYIYISIYILSINIYCYMLYDVYQNIPICLFIQPPAKRHRGIQGFLRQAFAGVEVRGPVASFRGITGGSPGSSDGCLHQKMQRPKGLTNVYDVEIPISNFVERLLQNHAPFNYRTNVTSAWSFLAVEFRLRVKWIMQTTDDEMCSLPGFCCHSMCVIKNSCSL